MSPTNLSYQTYNPQLATGVHGSPMTQTAVLHAAERLMPYDDYFKVRDGYRRSIANLDSLVEDYMRGDLPAFSVIKDNLYYECVQLARTMFSPPQTYRPVHFVDLRYYPYPLNSSAEAPYTSNPLLRRAVVKLYEQKKLPSPRLNFHNLYNLIFKIERQNVHRAKLGYLTDYQGNDILAWNTAHARAHLVSSEDPDKTRMVFGVPKRLIFVETMFFWPLMRWLMESDSPMLWGHETIKGGWYKLANYFSVHQPRAQTFLALDWKQFDKRAKFEVIDDIHFKIILSYLDLKNGYIPTINYPESETDEWRLMNLFRYMNYAVKFTPDALPNGHVFRRTMGGIASGFFQTQILGSIYNMIILLTTLADAGINVNNISIKVQGDDSIIAINEYIPPERHQNFLDQLADIALRRFDAVLNTKKSKINNNLNGLPVLGYTNLHSYPIRSKFELLASLAYPERQCDPSRLMARCIGIAWADCGNNPKVFEVCKDVHDYFKSEGYSPNMTGLPDIIKAQDLILKQAEYKSIVSSEFPSVFDTTRHLFSMIPRSTQQKEQLWPTSHFLSEY